MRFVVCANIFNISVLRAGGVNSVGLRPVVPRCGYYLLLGNYAAAAKADAALGEARFGAGGVFAREYLQFMPRCFNGDGVARKFFAAYRAVNNFFVFAAFGAGGFGHVFAHGRGLGMSRCGYNLLRHNYIAAHRADAAFGEARFCAGGVFAGKRLQCVPGCFNSNGIARNFRIAYRAVNYFVIRAAFSAGGINFIFHNGRSRGVSRGGYSLALKRVAANGTYKCAFALCGAGGGSYHLPFAHGVARGGYAFALLCFAYRAGAHALALFGASRRRGNRPFAPLMLYCGNLDIFLKQFAAYRAIPVARARCSAGGRGSHNKVFRRRVIGIYRHGKGDAVARKVGNDNFLLTCARQFIYAARGGYRLPVHGNFG